MTEEDALKLWCPFARVSDTEENAASVNRNWSSGASERGCYCIGSQCMAWRWFFVEGDKPESDDGFCGLAGRTGAI